MLGLDECFQVFEARLPERPIVAEPRIDGLQRAGIQLVDAVPALSAFPDEAGAAQQAQVFGDGRPGNGKRLGDAAGGPASVAEEIEDGAARGIGQSAERAFVGVGNRTVTHNA